jgi:hypothetical protein
MRLLSLDFFSRENKSPKVELVGSILRRETRGEKEKVELRTKGRTEGDTRTRSSLTKPR